jgi:transcriptional regulator with XRE-family HTH domain
MNTTRELLAAVKRRHHLTSDYQLAKFLEISAQRISKYMSGKVTLGDEAAMKVADALGIERGRALAIVAAERTQSDQAKKEWLKLAGTAAAVAVVALLGVEHGAQLVDLASVSSQALYIMSNAAAAALAALALVRVFLTVKSPSPQ